MDSIPGRVKPKTLKFIFAASPQSTKHLGVRAKTGQPRVRILCLGKVTRLFLRTVAFVSTYKHDLNEKVMKIRPKIM